MKVIYKNTILTANGTIAAEGNVSPSIIIFRNQGTSIVNIFGNMKLYPGKEFRIWHKPGVVIENSFVITFETTPAGLVNNLSVVRGYYKD